MPQKKSLVIRRKLEVRCDIVGRDDLHLCKDAHIGGRVYQKHSLLVPPGLVLPFAGSEVPCGYLLCDGSEVCRHKYADLFNAIGTTYGTGDGATTFNLPDLQGRMILGANVTYPLTSTGGSATKTLSVAELPAHSHTVTDPGHFHNTTNGYDDANASNIPGQAPNGDSSVNLVTGYPTDSATTGITIDNTGSGDSFDILNPYIAMNYVIKY